MYSRANVRAGKVLRLPIEALPSVIVVTEKVMREADGPVGRAALTPHIGWKGDPPGVRLEYRTGEPVRSPKNTSVQYNNEQETSEIQFEDFALKTNVLAFSIRSKAKARPRRRTLACSSTRTVPIWEGTWTGIEPADYSPIVYPVAKRLNTLLRHGELPREEDGAIEFWRLKDDHRNKFENSQHWSDDVWKSKMAGGGGNKKRFQICTDPSRQEILYLRTFQGHSGRNPIDPTLQENVLIPNKCLRVQLSYWMCSQFTLHHTFRIDSGRTKF